MNLSKQQKRLLEEAHQIHRNSSQDKKLYTCDWCKRRRPRKDVLLGNNSRDQYVLMGRGYNGSKDGTPWPKVECRNDRQACEWYSSLWRQVHDAIHDYEEGRTPSKSEELDG